MWIIFHCKTTLLVSLVDTNIRNLQLKKDAVVSHSLALINNGLSTVSIKLSTDENHFSVAGVTPALSGGNEFTTLHPSDSVHVSLLSHSLSLPPSLSSSLPPSLSLSLSFPPSLTSSFSLPLSFLHTYKCTHTVYTSVFSPGLFSIAAPMPSITLFL